MKKADLRTGMFGIMNGDKEDVFVIANGYLVYQNGKCDPINGGLFFDGMSDDLSFYDNKITHLYEAICFNEVKMGKADLIWERDSEETTEEDENFDPELKSDLDEMAKATKEIHQSYLDAGFNEEQAWKLTNTMLGQVMAQNALQNLFGGTKK